MSDGDGSLPVSGRRVAALAGRRIAAWCVDWLVISGYAAALIPLGLLLVGYSHRWSPLAANAVALATLVVPAWLWMAAWERGPRAASPGKRLLRLRADAVQRTALGWRRSLVRNGLKLAVPWELGHTAAFTLADVHASGPATAIGLTGGLAACLIGCGYLVSLFVGTGRTPYDLASGARVVAVPPRP